MSLTLKNIKKTFGDKLILDGFSYEFPDRGVYVITGESGIGKTTLLRIIAGLEEDFSGEISGNSSISMAFQEYRLFPTISALDNLVFTISNRKSEAVVSSAAKMLRELGIDDKDMRLLPEELSGGMKQRVSLARAFLKDAKILLLDEPTKELDPENAERVRKIIKSQGKARLVILVSHAEADLRIPDSHIIHLS